MTTESPDERGLATALGEYHANLTSKGLSAELVEGIVRDAAKALHHGEMELPQEYLR